MKLVPEGTYRLEANLAAIASLKLVERPEGVAKEVTRQKRGTFRSRQADA